MADTFVPTLWYYTATNRAGFVFSGPAAAWVVNTDATYLAWVTAGNVAINFATDGALAFSFAVEASRQQQGGGFYTALAALALAVAPTSWGALSRPQVLATVLLAGVVLTSTGTAALDGTYEVSGVPFDNIRYLAAYCAAFAALPNAAGSIVYAARSGTITFSSDTEVLAVYRGLVDYWDGWRVWFISGGAAPTFGTITIA